jgi:ubiquinone/menaquinone biosynthesis C-methylase UbiE
MTTTLKNTWTVVPDLRPVKTRQQAAWSTGNYAVIGTTLQIVGEELCEALDLRSGSQVLDVAAGNGNFSLAAARRWCSVMVTDYVPPLLNHARHRAEADGLTMEFRVADAEELPFANESFDVVASTFGVMFTPDQERAAAELVRVCRKGGAIGLANWTPFGFIGQLFKTLGTYVPPASGVPSPALWGTRERIAELFEQNASTISCKTKYFTFRYRSAKHWLGTFLTYYGPLTTAFGALSSAQQVVLEHELLELVAHFNRAGDGTMVVPSEYLETLIARQ